MIIKEEFWSNIPLLHIVEKDLIEKDVPVAIFLHGFTSAKEHNLHYAYNLAKKGVRVLLPDAHLHGAREENLDEVELALRFWEIVLTSIEEVGVIQEELKKRGLLIREKIGVGGTSMGGITTLGSLTLYDWIATGVVMMGAPGFVELAEGQITQFEQDGFQIPITNEEKSRLFEKLAMFDLTKHPSALMNRPVYFWHGKKDPTVPYAPTYKFYEKVKADYAENPERLRFVTDRVAAHSVTRSGMLEAVDWFASHLKE